MPRLLTQLRYGGFSMIDLPLTGVVGATALGAGFFHVGTARELLVWGAWGVLIGVLIGGVMATAATRRTRRALNRTRGLVPLATDEAYAAALRAAAGGPIPTDPTLRRAGALLAADRLERMPRKSMVVLVTGGVFVTLAAFSTIAWDMSYWAFAPVGWGMLAEQLPTWRVHRRVNRLAEKPDRQARSSP